MKKMRVFLLSTILCASFITPCWASNALIPSSEIVLRDVSTRAEVTKWYYRNHEGVKQKRLWSVTYGYWKTEWMPV
jgi:hypothetical protein